MIYEAAKDYYCRHFSIYKSTHISTWKCHDLREYADVQGIDHKSGKHMQIMPNAKATPGQTIQLEDAGIEPPSYSSAVMRARAHSKNY